MKSQKLILGMLLSLFMLSCSNNDSNSTSDLSEAKVNAKIDVITDDVSKVVDDQFGAQFGVSGKSSESITSFLPSCAVVTATVSETTWTRTVVFTNCTLPNGNVLDGTIIVSGSTNADLPSHTISYSFVNFHHNNILVEGNRTVTRNLQSTATLATLHPVANMSIDMTVTFPNGNSYHRVGNRIREMIEGFDTQPIWQDNVFSITGSWTTTSTNGSQSSTITTPLISKMNCPNIVSGIVQIVRNNNTATLDYGNGDCDNQATLTINGTTTTITLGN